MKRFKFRIGVDVDDILFSCNDYAVQLANQTGNFNPPLSTWEIKGWGPSGTRTDILLNYYHDPVFFETQPVMNGAKEFIRELSKKAEVFLITAVTPEFMGIRAKRLMEAFPEIPAGNLMMGARKDIVDVDMLLDDGSHNIAASMAAYPVLMRRPWNQHVTGCLSVNNYEQFLTLVDTILKSYTAREPVPGNKIIALIGPSGSGKKHLIKHAENKGLVRRVMSYTTNKFACESSPGGYHYISKEDFLIMEGNGEFFETTRYAAECFGSSRQSIEAVLHDSHAVMPVDICGAIALKHAFPKHALLIFVSRSKEELLGHLLGRNYSNEEKIRRILSLDDECRNEELCDYTIHNYGNIEDMTNELAAIITKEKR